MATNTYVALRTSTVGTATNTVDLDLTGITGYTDLVVVYSGTMSPADYVLFRVGNGTIDTSSNYSSTRIVGNGSTATSGRDSNATFFAAPEPLNTNQNNIIVQFQNYANTSVNKTMLMRANVPLTDAGAAGTVSAVVGLWRSTAAINKIRFSAYSSGNFQVGSTFTVYGIAAIGGDTTPKATGGVVTQDATYYYHTFAGSNTFTALQSLTADIFVVAGGGAGGAAYSAGGGGAGGVLYFASQSLSAAPYNCIVGAGGAPWVGNYQQNNTNNGNDSQFGSLTLVKGGGAGGVVTTYVAGKNGGSGGGAGGEPTGATGGSGTSGQGNNGGNGSNSGGGTGAGGGGGGWGAVGQNSSSSTGGNGGAGNYNALTDAIGPLASIGQLSSGHYYFAGGGGASAEASGGTQGLGGVGGGANAKRIGVGNNATVNTGGGGGAIGGDFGGTGGGGGSGVIIVRYAK